ncbi:hypothetical protein AO382_1440 [Moraxella catarrhalis]|uniref:Uncharacterized protein n=1 Tax=Moraxella catarrhalis TaxID=480 RepID=A0A7Z0UXV2_MORCA|nr:hypothetical protein AO382_1440 [Moraxella catarrhalis]
MPPILPENFHLANLFLELFKKFYQIHWRYIIKSIGAIIAIL